MTKKSLRVGDTIPPFSLQSATGETVTREDLLGKGPVVIYFYPRDETPGCTAQACSFRDSYEVFTDAGAEVVGVSSDTAESHRAFAEHHRLPFVLLADPKSALRRAFGVPKTLGLMQGRVTYVADREGVIRHVFDSQLLVNQHVTEALATVQALTAN
ncbi:MAG: peroxiredoxin [Myxococcota bacterium]|nr:peroxiredoxin [Myxococcota bacterium]